MGIEIDFPLCLTDKISAKELDGLINILTGFIKALPKFIEPSIITKVPEFPKAAFDIILSGLDKSKVPSFSFSGVSFKGTNIGLDLFKPDGLINFMQGLLKIPLGIPELFFDLSKAPAVVPKVPTFDAIINLITKSLGLDEFIPDFPGKPQFIEKFCKCLAKSVAKQLGIPS